MLPVLRILLDIVKGVYQRYVRFGKSHFLIILRGPYRRFPGPLEEVQTGPSLDILSLSPWNLLGILYIVPRNGHWCSCVARDRSRRK